MSRKYFKKGEPTVRNSAAVIHSKVEISFISKEQCDEFVSEYIKSNEYPSISLETVVGDSIKLDVYIVTIHDIPWANNLKTLGKILEKYDYNC